MLTDYYLLLGVERGANLSQIRRAYLACCRQFDPDDAAAASPLFEEMSAAMRTLAQSMDRADYDDRLQASDASQANEAARPPLLREEAIDLFDSYQTHKPSAEEITDDIEKRTSDQASRKSHPPRAVNLELLLSPAEAAAGGRVSVTVPISRACSVCAGTGSAGYFSCDACGGHGMLWNQHPVEVLIPPHVRGGTVIPVSLNHLGARNLYLNIHVRVGSAAEA